MIKIIDKILEAASYDNRRKKAVSEYKEMRDRYLMMSEEEISMEYVEITAKYEYKKMALTVVIVSIVISSIMNLWGYLYDVLLRIAVFYGTNDAKFIEVAAVLVVMIMTIAILAALWIICNKMKTIYRLNKKRLFLEQIESMKNKNDFRMDKVRS